MMLLEKISLTIPLLTVVYLQTLNFNLWLVIQPQTSELPNEFQTGNGYFLKAHTVGNIVFFFAVICSSGTRGKQHVY